MSEIVGEQQNSTPLNEAAAQSTEALKKEITNNVEEAVPAANKIAPNATEETGEELLQQPAVEESSSASPKVDNKKTPVKRTRMSFIERAQKESEELVRTLGGSLEMEGGRKTRSSTRGTPTRSVVASTPPPVKKSRNSPASGSSTPTRGRGRGRKLDTTADGSAEEETSPTTSKKKTPAKSRKSAAKENLDDEKQNVEETEKIKEDTSTPATNAAKEDNVEAAATSESVSAQAKTEEAETENNETTAADVDKTDNNDVNKESENVDNTDAGLEPVVEETQSQAAAETDLTEENIAKESDTASHDEKVIEQAKNNDSPMETEQSQSEENEEKEKQNLENTNTIDETVKEPTPEPMEVDSSSKSNEAFEKMEDEVIEKPQTSAPAVNAVAKTAEENVPQNSLPTNEVAAAIISSDVVENNIKTGANMKAVPNVAFGNLKANNTEETTPAANNDTNKTENNLCEPKIATSPTIPVANDNGAVTTPQTCN